MAPFPRGTSVDGLFCNEKTVILFSFWDPVDFWCYNLCSVCLRVFSCFFLRRTNRSVHSNLVLFATLFQVVQVLPDPDYNRFPPGYNRFSRFYSYYQRYNW